MTRHATIHLTLGTYHMFIYSVSGIIGASVMGAKGIMGRGVPRRL